MVWIIYPTQEIFTETLQIIFTFGTHSTTPGAGNTNKRDRVEHRPEPLSTSGLPIALSASVTLPVGADVTQSQVRFIDRDTGQPISGWEAILAGMITMIRKP